jgi:hypothetical protein
MEHHEDPGRTLSDAIKEIPETNKYTIYTREVRKHGRKQSIYSAKNSVCI